MGRRPGCPRSVDVLLVAAAGGDDDPGDEPQHRGADNRPGRRSGLRGAEDRGVQVCRGTRDGRRRASAHARRSWCEFAVRSSYARVAAPELEPEPGASAGSPLPRAADRDAHGRRLSTPAHSVGWCGREARIGSWLTRSSLRQAAGSREPRFARPLPQRPGRTGRAGCGRTTPWSGRAAGARTARASPVDRLVRFLRLGPLVLVAA